MLCRAIAHMHTILLVTYYLTDCTLVLTYEHIITQNKSNTNIYKVKKCCDQKAIGGTTINNTYNFTEWIACLYITTS